MDMKIQASIDRVVRSLNRSRSTHALVDLAKRLTSCSPAEPCGSGACPRCTQVALAAPSPQPRHLLTLIPTIFNNCRAGVPSVKEKSWLIWNKTNPTVPANPQRR